AERHADAAARIEAAMSTGDAATAERIAHTVRGVAGSLGFDSLFTAATALEHAIAGKGDRSGAAAEFEKRLSHATASLHAALAPADAVTAAPVDLAQAGLDAARLAELLAASDGDAVDHFEQS